MNSLAARFAAGVLLLGAMAAAADDRDDEMVCVPAEDGRSWVCGTRANPPPDRGAAVLPRRTASAPPPFLAAPGGALAPLAPANPPAARPPRDAFPPAPDRDTAAVAAETRPVEESGATAVETLPEPPAATASPGSVSAPVERPSAPTTAPPPAPPPLLAAPRPRLAPYAPVAPMAATPAPRAAEAGSPGQPADTVADPQEATPAPVVSEPVVPESVTSEPVASEPVASEPVASEPVASEPVASEPVAPELVASEPSASEPVAPALPAAEPSATETVSSEPAPTESIAPAPESSAIDTPPVADSAAFLAVPANRATLQLARAGRVGDLYATWQRMVADSGGALASGTAYVITLDAGGTPQALLLWSDFADPAAARAAWEALPGFPAGKPAAYARRIAPLQDEIRRSAPSR